MTSDELLLCVRIACCFLFLPLQRASDSRERPRAPETLSCGKRNESIHTSIYLHREVRTSTSERGRERPWHDAGLFLLKVTLATTISLSLSYSVYDVLSFSLSLSLFIVSVCPIWFVLFSIPFPSHLTCALYIIWARTRDINEGNS